MKTRHHFFHKCIFILLYLIIAIGCTTSSKPNKPYSGSYPAAFNNLANKNTLLAQELGKIPEIQDGISDSEKTSLERLFEIYNNHQDLFNSVFNEMYSTGKPEIRKYCTPLQALFWVIEKNQYNDFRVLFENYTINKLLDLSWNFKKENLLSTRQIETVIEETKNSKIKVEYLDTYKNYGASKVEKHLLFDFDRKPSWFTWNARKILKEAQRLKFEKWNEFDVVIERLNSPEIINHYEKRRINYQPWSTISGASPGPPPQYPLRFQKQ